MRFLRVLSRLLFLATVSVLGVDALLLGVLMFPEVAEQVPALPDGSPDDLLPIVGWIVAFGLLVWLLTRRKDYHSPGPEQHASPYARAIPAHHDGVDLLAGKPGAGAYEMAEVLRSTASVEQRDAAEKEAAKWEAGAQAEEKAARLLKALGPNWTVLHDITVHHRGWNIDHVAIGPQGVFVINTKTTGAPTIIAEGDRLVIHGWHTDYIPKSRNEGFRTAVALFGRPEGVPVTPVLLFVNAPPIEFRSPPGDVWITEEHNVVAALTGGPIRLSPKQYGRLVAKARHQSTWIDGWEQAQRLSRKHGHGGSGRMV